jgi:hypothetical protein
MYEIQQSYCDDYLIGFVHVNLVGQKQRECLGVAIL